MTKRYYFYLGLGILVAMFTLGRCSRGKGNPGLTSNGPKGSATPVLPKQDKELISFNEKTHEVTVQTATKTIKEYANNPVVEIRKDGSVSVSRHLAGFENNLFIGAGYGDTGRILLGDNLAHFGRIDLGGAIAWSPDANAVAFKPVLTLGYNVWDNVSVGVGVNALSGLQTKGVDMIGFISVKL
jgi:hypothetical protein